MHDFAMEELISCLVLLSPPRLILPSQVPELTNITAEKTALIEALSFLGPRGLVGRGMDSCIYDSKHAVGVCLGTIQARTHLQLALACQRSMLCTQHRLRLTMQHVSGHTGTWVMNVPIMHFFTWRHLQSQHCHSLGSS